MRVYYDCEFIERGPAHPIELISIGMVREDDQTYYAVASDGWDETHASDWVREHVLPSILGIERTARATIAEQIFAFAGPSPRFYGYYADYDHVLLCQLYDRMIALPAGWPMWTYDIKQLAHDLGNPPLPKQESVEHHALADAIHIKRMHEVLLALAPFARLP